MGRKLSVVGKGAAQYCAEDGGARNGAQAEVANM
jgi:hypothetical protein